MKKLPLSLFSLLLLSSCSTTTLTSLFQRETYLPEDDLHELHLEIADLKHAIGSQRVQIEILEEKLVAQNAAIGALKSQGGARANPKGEQITQDLALLEKKVSLLNKAHEQLTFDVRQLSNHANQTSTILTQCKEQLQSFEKSISSSNQKINEIAKLKSTITSFSESTPEKAASLSTTNYKVRSGDSLGKIAIEHNTSVEMIRELNNLTSDRIFVGSELLIPNEN